MPPNGKCPQKEERSECPLVCKYNHFEGDDFTIDAWELKCLDCGWRDTIAHRSDELEDDDDIPEDFDATQCPFCENCGLATGKNPCQS